MNHLVGRLEVHRSPNHQRAIEDLGPTGCGLARSPEFEGDDLFLALLTHRPLPILIHCTEVVDVVLGGDFERLALIHRSLHWSARRLAL